MYTSMIHDLYIIITSHPKSKGLGVEKNKEGQIDGDGR